MFKGLMFLWKTRILKEVVYDEKGLPIDCKGLQIKGKGVPFEEGTLYKVSSEWSDYDYLGKGKYWSKTGLSLRVDKLNPFYKMEMRKSMKDFGERMEKFYDEK